MRSQLSLARCCQRPLAFFLLFISAYALCACAAGSTSLITSAAQSGGWILLNQDRTPEAGLSPAIQHPLGVVFIFGKDGGRLVTVGNSGGSASATVYNTANGKQMAQYVIKDVLSMALMQGPGPYVTIDKDMAYFLGLQQKPERTSVVLVRLNLQTGTSSVVQIPGKDSPWAIYRSSDALLVPHRQMLEVYSLKIGQFLPQTIPCEELASNNGFVIANGKGVYEWEANGAITQIATDDLKPVAKAIPWQLSESVLSISPCAAADKTENLLVLASVVEKGHISTEKSKLMLVDPASQKIIVTQELPFSAKPPLVMSSNKQLAWIVDPKGQAIGAFDTQTLVQAKWVHIGGQLSERQWEDLRVLGDSSR